MELGQSDDESLRFKPSQAMILDALLAAQPDAEVDAHFAQVREKLHSFEGVQPAAAPKGFVGKLREYQSAGLGWLHFLRDFQFGGCLADDMGLGKTVQLLAFLQARRAAPEGGERRPSLVVAPRSLVFNWIDEAARFAPDLEVLDYTGAGRGALRRRLESCDLIVTTYGTLRRDADFFSALELDCAVLDEAQAIKNSASLTARAARLLRARQRLALSGTPIENHLGELLSLFEFLNPGMLGRAGTFAELAGRGSADPDLQALSTALRPFFLRRRKEEVLADLPPKTEQVLLCTLGKQERRRYDELREHYRASLLARESEVGLGRMKIHVLEALLRLRQAALHPGLIDDQRTDEGSAKLDALLPRLEAAAESGKKALVFSQFTGLLSIVRKRLDTAGIPYEYLAGRTRDRKQRVERFQTDAAVPLFLISLKAGGQGLNLTAADYVFLLDPWWNPAVEAQAVDRAHRIGRERPVVAYRLIARGTIEERVQELQASKRALASALFGESAGGLAGLTRADLESLFAA
jgi:SNF2 family DNA or RNA helicase